MFATTAVADGWYPETSAVWGSPDIPRTSRNRRVWPEAHRAHRASLKAARRIFRRRARPPSWRQA